MAFDLAGAKRNFFDRAAVIGALTKAEAKALSKFGAFVRTRSRSSIRKRKQPSPPGQPPSSHVGTLRRFIMFGYDAPAKSTVIGPTLAGPQSGAPRALEEGGTAVMRRRTATRTIHVEARPFMKPAFDAELSKAGGEFRNLIR